MFCNLQHTWRKFVSFGITISFLLCCNAIAYASSQSEIIPLKGVNFENTVVNDDDIWAVLLTAPVEQCPHCGQVESALSKVAPKLSGLMRFGRLLFNEPLFNSEGELEPAGQVYGLVNTTDGTARLPALLIYQYGPKRTLDGIVWPPEVVAQLAQLGVKTLWKQLRAFVPGKVSSVDERKLSQFLDSEPDTGRVLLFTEKLGQSPLYKKLSLDFDNRGVFGEVSSHMQRLARAFGVEKYPSLIVTNSPLQPDPPKELTDSTSSIEDVPQVYKWAMYDGPLEFESLTAFLDEKLPSMSVKQIKSNGDFDRICKEASGICVFGVLSSNDIVAPTSTASKEYKTFFQAASRSYLSVDMNGLTGQASSIHAQRMPLQFVWIDGQTQTAFTEAFSVPSFPTVVALNPRKKLYSILTGAFTSDEIRRFALSIADGSATLHSIEKLPQFVLQTESQYTSSSQTKMSSRTSKSSTGGPKKLSSKKVKRKVKKSKKSEL